MATASKLGFIKPHSALQSGIYIPRYYDPAIERRLKQLVTSHRLVRFGDLLDSGDFTVHYGHDIGKHTYGLGTIPYVRTSDIATWEIVSAPKQTVGDATYNQYASRQDVRAGDVMFIRDGLYLIGLAALVTKSDLPLLHQSHLVRFRASPDSPISGPLLLALLSTPIVRLQVRSKQFTAGIIDKIEDRYRELVLPLPKSETSAVSLGAEVESVVLRRVQLREVLKRIPHWAQGLIDNPTSLEAVVHQPSDESSRYGFSQRMSMIRSGILIPKYYDPSTRTALKRLERDFLLRSIGDLVNEGVIEVHTGLEVGKLAYGLGDVPFIRTSDLADWELAGQPKQRVSASLYRALRLRTDVRPNDILLVRDGTYLVGTSAILTRDDARALFAGGLYKLRCLRPDRLDPFLLLALLNMPIVKRQIRSKQFTRDIIDTLGLRLYEVIVPIPRSRERQEEIARLAEGVVTERVELRDRAKKLALCLEGTASLAEEEREIAEELTL
jgi:hypothetical protein